MADIDKNEKCAYCDQTIEKLIIIYIILILFWIFIIVCLDIYHSIESIILLIPVIVFLLGMINLHSITPTIEDEMFKASYLSIGLILALPLVTWMSKDFKGDHSKFICTIIVALSLSLITLIDLWVSREWYCVYKHTKSGLQTMAITLLIYSMFTYLINRSGTYLQ